MNRKEAAEFSPIIQAFAEGKDIEYRSKRFNEDWKKVTQIPALSFESFEYRIKLEPKYRPFANAEECWQEMEKHQPFGWVKCKSCYYNIVAISNIDVVLVNFSGVSFARPIDKVMDEYTFVDGATFGIKVEE